MEQKQTGILNKLVDFVKKEAVLCVALVLAVLSAILVPPGREYLDYIDFRTLAVLLCLMAVMAGLQGLGIFQKIARFLLSKVKSYRAVMLVLVLLCFFFSMVITNDVALITFVPFTFTVLGMLGQQARERYIIPVVVLQTAAANLGSMLTPIGNPQNLYLYGQAGISVGRFLWLMLPYTVVSLVVIVIWCLCLKGPKGELTLDFVEADRAQAEDMQDRNTQGRQGAFGQSKGHKSTSAQLYIYLALFIVCLLAVAHILPYQVMLVIVLLVILVMDVKVLGRVDYSLLLTFVGFFIFIGNMGRIPAFSTFLRDVIVGNEVYTAILSSQVISNVPAALLLSGFTTDYGALIVGTNLGGLGTLIASMASLISYKYIAGDSNCNKGKYFIYFTLVNICILTILVILYMVVG